MFTALNGIVTTQDNPTEYVQDEFQQLIYCLVTYPNIVRRSHASDVVLLVDSDAEYQVLPKEKSRISGYFYLPDHPSKTN